MKLIENLSEEQKIVVKGWIAEGLSLAQIQKQLHVNFQVNLTYMEVRFLVDDLGIPLKDKILKQDEPKSLPIDALNLEDNIEEKLGDVTISVDKVMRAGTLISGAVCFSDGQEATWHMDELGRIGILPKNKSYKPSHEDLQKFQRSLQQALQKAGF